MQVLDVGPREVNGHAPALELHHLGPALAWPQDPPSAAEPDRLRTWCTVALWAIAVLIAAASAASFAESYRGLWLWARHHGFSGFWAAAFPAQVDVFIAVGELALFVALVLAWRRRSRIGAWCVTLAGLAVSVAGNVGHVAGSDIASRVTAGVPPVAATVALAVGLGVLKRLVRGDSEDDTEPPPDTPAITPRHDKRDDKPPRRPPARKPDPEGTKFARAAAVIRDNPGMTNPELAELADCDVRTIQRARKGKS